MKVKKLLHTKKNGIPKLRKILKIYSVLLKNAIAHDPNLNVVIVKRLQRFDRTSKDILGIKSQLSKFANHAYDQIWLKRGSPNRIHIVDLELGCDNYQYLKDLIYGQPSDAKFDGIHLIGNGAKRHFTYRASHAISVIITKPFQQKHKTMRTDAKIAGKNKKTREITQL
jgi:hypothetical protein